MSSTEPTDTNRENAQKEELADFEKAIDTAGFGIYNWFLLFVALLGSFANNFETTTMSFILPIAECDLRLSLQDKGILNASTYAGMILSAMIWGYLADTKGRRKLLIICYLLDAVCVIASSMSQNTETLIAFKFLGGIMVNGPSSIMYTYFIELHSAKNRPRIIMFIGMALSLGNLVLPLLAWAIFPRSWDFVLFESLNVHSWQIFLLVCSMPSLISGIIIIFLPESPKFLMSQGRNCEALRVFQKIYAINKRQPKETYPIKQLVEEVPSRDFKANVVIETNLPNGENIDRKKSKRQHRSLSQSIHDGIKQMKPLFRKPLLGHAIYAIVMQFCILFGLNTIRLWLPQLFASFTEYESLHSSNSASADLCTLLEYNVNKTATVVSNYEERCAVRPEISIDMYINIIIVCLCGVIGYLVGTTIIRAIGSKTLMVSGLFISGCLGISLYWSINSTTTLVISAVYLTVASVSTMSLLGTVVELFPTSLRTFIIATCLMFGRLGALTGNMLFPLLIEWGCIPPFVTVGTVMLSASALSFLLPSAKKATFT